MKEISFIVLVILSAAFLIAFHIRTTRRPSTEDTELFYSTPVGEDTEGNTHVYVISCDSEDTPYYPVFRSKETCIAFFESIGRGPFLICKGSLSLINRQLDEDPLFETCGIVIDPNTENEIVLTHDKRRLYNKT